MSWWKRKPKPFRDPIIDGDRLVIVRATDMPAFKRIGEALGTDLMRVAMSHLINEADVKLAAERTGSDGSVV